MTDLSALARRLRSRRNTIRGSVTEEIVGMRLRALGFLFVHPVSTGWRVTRIKGRIVGASPMAKVQGDFTAIEPTTGRYVLIEVKSRQAAKLPWSAFETHQTRALDEVQRCGGIALVVWIATARGLAFLPWSLAGPALKAAPLTWERALEMQPKEYRT